jgi:hypothetical protein
MTTIAQILNNKAHWIFSTDETLEQVKSRFAPDMVFIDITDRPEVQEGWDCIENQFMEPIVPTVSIDELKQNKIAYLKSCAFNELFPTDYKIVRHIGQKATGIPITLTEEEILSLEQSRQLIRDKCNQLETQVNNVTTKEETEAIVWA